MEFKLRTENTLLTVEELAELLRCPPSWIYSRTRQRSPQGIPTVRVGKYCRFRLQEVLDWLEKRQNAEG